MKMLNNALIAGYVRRIIITSFTQAFSFMKTLKLIRMMSNTSVQVGAGCTVYTPGRYITAQNLEKIRIILKPLGLCQQVPESMLNAMTALMACGSAYV